MNFFPFLRQFGAPDVFFPRAPACTWNCMEPSRPVLCQCAPPPGVFFPGAPACTWKCMAHLSSFSPSIWRPWSFLPWSPCLHLKLHGAPLVLFSVNLAPLTFPSLEPLLALETAWCPSRPFSPSIWRPWRFLPWSPCLHLKLHGTPLVLFSVNLAPLTFPSLEPLLALETAWRPSRPFSPSIWRPWRFPPWSPCLHLKLHGTPLVLFSVNLAPQTFSSLESLLALETAWRISRPFLCQFGTPDVFFPGAPACTWNCMAPVSSFSSSIWRPWWFLPFSLCLHLKLHGAPLVLFLHQFGAPDVFFPGAPACTWNCMAPLSSFSPSIWRPWRFLPWSPCLHLKLHGAPLVLFSVNMAPLTFSSLEPLLSLETAWHPSRPFLRQFGAPDVFFPGAPACTWNCRRNSRRIDLTFFLSFFFLAPSSFPFFFLIPFFSSFLLFSPSLFLSLSFFLSFWRPFGDPGGPGPPKPPPQDTPLNNQFLHDW